MPGGDKFENEGPRAALFHDSRYNMATKNTSLTLCTVDIEILTVSFTTKNIEYPIMSVYRPPSGNITAFTQESDKIITKA